MGARQGRYLENHNYFSSYINSYVSFHVIHLLTTITMATPSDLTVLNITGKYIMVRQALPTNPLLTSTTEQVPL